MRRRGFLTGAAVAAGAATLGGLARGSTTGATASDAFIDTNVSLGQWPVRHTWATTPAQLAAKLRTHGVTAAWAGSWDGVLETDLAGANARLAAACAATGGFLRPFGTVNPLFPDWEDDLRRCHEVHRMPGVRLYPNYHGYGLDEPRLAALLARARDRKLLVQVALSIEDERSQNPVLVAAPVNVAPLPDVLAKIPGARVMLLNSGSRVLIGNSVLLRRLTEAGVAVELATLEGVGGLENLLRGVPGARIAFGSHAPYFYFEAALLKLRESALTPEQLAAIRSGHAQAALSP